MQPCELSKGPRAVRERNRKVAIAWNFQGFSSCHITHSNGMGEEGAWKSSMRFICQARRLAKGCKNSMELDERCPFDPSVPVKMMFLAIPPPKSRKALSYDCFRSRIAEPQLPRSMSSIHAKGMQ